MVARVLRPEGKGFLFLDSHPAGCVLTVGEMISEAGASRAGGTAAPARPADIAVRVLVIGCSGGYGLAAAVAGLAGCGARVLGGCDEGPATARRSASAGWYRTAALAGRATAGGLRFDAINGDCLGPAVRSGVLDDVSPAPADSHGRLRLDASELAADQRRDIAARWSQPTERLPEVLADLDWFRGEIWRRYGFGVPGVDYDQPVEADVSWPPPAEPAEP